MKDVAYQVYLDMVRDNLVASNLRLLTEKEEEIVVAHLVTTALTFCNEPPLENDLGLYTRRLLGNFSIRQILSIEAAKKVCEIHPDIPTPTQEQIKKVTEAALSERTFLLTQSGRSLE